MNILEPVHQLPPKANRKSERWSSVIERLTSMKKGDKLPIETNDENELKSLSNFMKSNYNNVYQCSRRGKTLYIQHCESAKTRSLSAVG